MRSAQTTLMQIEALQDEILDRLAELNDRLEALLHAEMPSRAEVTATNSAADAAA